MAAQTIFVSSAVNLDDRLFGVRENQKQSAGTLLALTQQMIHAIDLEHRLTIEQRQNAELHSGLKIHSRHTHHQ